MKKQNLLLLFFIVLLSIQLNAQDNYETYVDSALSCKTCLVKFPVHFYNPDLYPQDIGVFFIEDKSNFYKNHNIIIHYDTLSNEGSISGKIDSAEFLFHFQLPEKLEHPTTALELYEINSDFYLFPDSSSGVYFEKEDFQQFPSKSENDKNSIQLTALKEKVLNNYIESGFTLEDINAEQLLYTDVFILNWEDSIRYTELKKIFNDSLSYLEYKYEMEMSGRSTTTRYYVSEYIIILNGESTINWKNQPKTQVVSHWKNGVLDGNYSYIENGCEYGGNYRDEVKNGEFSYLENGYAYGGRYSNGVKDGNWLEVYNNTSILNSNWDNGILHGNWTQTTLGNEFGGNYEHDKKVGEWKILFYRNTVPHYFKMNFDSIGQIICLEAFQLANSKKIYDVIFSFENYPNDSIKRISAYVKTEYDPDGKIVKIRNGKFLKETAIMYRGDPFYMGSAPEEIETNFNTKISWDKFGVLKEEGVLKPIKGKQRDRFFIEN